MCKISASVVHVYVLHIKQVCKNHYVLGLGICCKSNVSTSTPNHTCVNNHNAKYEEEKVHPCKGETFTQFCKRVHGM